MSYFHQVVSHHWCQIPDQAEMTSGPTAASSTAAAKVAWETCEHSWVEMVCEVTVFNKSNFVFSINQLSFRSFKGSVELTTFNKVKTMFQTPCPGQQVLSHQHCAVLFRRLTRSQKVKLQKQVLRKSTM